MKYIDADKLKAEIERRRKQRIEANDKIAKGEIFTDTEDEFNSSLARYGNRLVYQELFEIICFIETLQQEQPEVDYNIIPLPEERMVSYIAYCLRREDDDCNCPTCGKHVTGLRYFPYYYDRENNDVYFATVCPKCGKIIISKE